MTWHGRKSECHGYHAIDFGNCQDLMWQSWCVFMCDAAISNYISCHAADCINISVLQSSTTAGHICVQHQELMQHFSCVNLDNRLWTRQRLCAVHVFLLFYIVQNIANSAKTRHGLPTVTLILPFLRLFAKISPFFAMIFLHLCA